MDSASTTKSIKYATKSEYVFYFVLSISTAISVELTAIA